MDMQGDFVSFDHLHQVFYIPWINITVVSIAEEDTGDDADDSNQAEDEEGRNTHQE